MKRRYAYMYPHDDGYYTGFETIEDALETARANEPMEKTVYITETNEFVPSIWHDVLIEDLQEAVDNECAGSYEGYLDNVSKNDREVLGDALQEVFIEWAKERGIEYWIDVPDEENCVLYDLRTEKPAEGVS
ncbi:hypothetical protein TAMA11512_21540 [Selenomonas sp. TAMA-11512]|uniref:hypothetical protein n=1 Tax=Selenomonas sp. TAMA-11512 TaxID=3095337 RepID=UPI003089935F|nr:hypothetical protein TAMA11512_21540 [Selenomonas sp. TAMA-11512]